MRNFFNKFANLLKWTYHKYRYRGRHQERYKIIMNMGNRTSQNTEGSSFTFFAIGDFGVPNNNIKRTAKAMDNWARQHGSPKIILGLGDNFYPYGVGSADDEQFRTCWSDIFLIYESLRVPWKMVLGNHDYMWEPQAQIDFHYNDKLNRDKLWHMPAKCYQFTECVSHTTPHAAHASAVSSPSSPVNESVPTSEASVDAVSADSTTMQVQEGTRAATMPAAVPVPELDFRIDFFALDTNACQHHVAHVFPDLVDSLLGFVDQLHTSLVGSTAEWKIVFGHHPMYTQGKGHGAVGKCLRKDYRPQDRPQKADLDGIRMPKGFGLEKALVTGGAHAYFSAHEHVFQHHQSKGVHSFVCGASGAEQRTGSGLYGGKDTTYTVDWVSTADKFGFVAAEVFKDRMVVRFVSAQGAVLREVCINK